MRAVKRDVLRRRKSSNRVYSTTIFSISSGVSDTLMRVLLVDHDSEGLETIARAIRGVLELDCVTSKGDALLLLRQNTYDVLIACERAVDGSGLDLLGRTTRTAVPLKRIFAAAPERLQLLGPRLAPFKVQRTINYPIDLEELWLAIAQVTGGPNDETDGTIERVVLDERGIPSAGTTPRAPIPPRPPAPLGGMRVTPAPMPSPTPAPAMARRIVGRAHRRRPPRAAGSRAAAARATATARATRAATPRRPAVARPRADRRRCARPRRRCSRFRRCRCSRRSRPRRRAPSFRAGLPRHRPKTISRTIAAQARLGVQRKVVDEASRRKRQRLLTACGIAVVVAGGHRVPHRKILRPGSARARTGHRRAKSRAWPSSRRSPTTSR